MRQGRRAMCDGVRLLFCLTGWSVNEIIEDRGQEE